MKQLIIGIDFKISPELNFVGRILKILLSLLLFIPCCDLKLGPFKREKSNYGGKKLKINRKADLSLGTGGGVDGEKLLQKHFWLPSLLFANT